MILFQNFLLNLLFYYLKMELILKINIFLKYLKNFWKFKLIEYSNPVFVK